MRQITVNIPAAGAQPGVANVHCSGKYFLLSALTASVSVLTSSSDEYYFDKTGSGFGDDLSPHFGALTFYNTSAAVNTVTFFVDSKPIKLPDVNISSSISVNTEITNNLSNCALETEIQLQVNSPSGAATQFAANATYFRRIVIIAQKSLDAKGGNANTGTVYIGNSAAHQPIALAPGDTYTIEADTGGKRDLASWYVSSDIAGDGVSVIGC